MSATARVEEASSSVIVKWSRTQKMVASNVRLHCWRLRAVIGSLVGVKIVKWMTGQSGVHALLTVEVASSRGRGLCPSLPMRQASVVRCLFSRRAHALIRVGTPSSHAHTQIVCGETGLGGAAVVVTVMVDSDLGTATSSRLLARAASHVIPWPQRKFSLATPKSAKVLHASMAGGITGSTGHLVLQHVKAV